METIAPRPQRKWLVIFLLLIAGLFLITRTNPVELLFDTEQPLPYSSDRFLVSLTAFPDQWQSADFKTRTIEDDNGNVLFETAEVSFNHPDNVEPYVEAGHHEIIGFVSLQTARRHFETEDGYWFETMAAESTPLTTTRYTTVADDYRAECGIFFMSVEHRCVIIARYGPYVSRFWVKQEATRLSNDALERVLSSIDQRFIDMGVK